MLSPFLRKFPGLTSAQNLVKSGAKVNGSCVSYPEDDSQQ